MSSGDLERNATDTEARLKDDIRLKQQEAFAKIGDQVAAVILEPYPANAGFVLPRPGYLELLRKLLSREDKLPE